MWDWLLVCLLVCIWYYSYICVMSMTCCKPAPSLFSATCNLIRLSTYLAYIWISYVRSFVNFTFIFFVVCSALLLYLCHITYYTHKNGYDTCTFYTSFCVWTFLIWHFLHFFLLLDIDVAHFLFLSASEHWCDIFYTSFSVWTLMWHFFFFFLLLDICVALFVLPSASGHLCAFLFLLKVRFKRLSVGESPWSLWM